MDLVSILPDYDSEPDVETAAPLRLPGQPDQIAHVSDKVAERLEDVKTLLQTRATASFWSGVDALSPAGDYAWDAWNGRGHHIDVVVFGPIYCWIYDGRP